MNCMSQILSAPDWRKGLTVVALDDAGDSSGMSGSRETAYEAHVEVHAVRGTAVLKNPDATQVHS